MTKSSAPSKRDLKLAAKLKENLRRRKAQTRARADDGSAVSDGKEVETPLDNTAPIQGTKS